MAILTIIAHKLFFLLICVVEKTEVVTGGIEVAGFGIGAGE